MALSRIKVDQLDALDGSPTNLSRNLVQGTSNETGLRPLSAWVTEFEDFREEAQQRINALDNSFAASDMVTVQGLEEGERHKAATSLKLLEYLEGGNTWIYIPGGTYHVDRPLRVEQCTRITLAPDCTLVNDIDIEISPDDKGNSEPIFINAVHGDVDYATGYGGDSYILIEGGVMDGQPRIDRKETCSSVKVSHCRDIVVRGVYFKNNYKSHFIEVNSCEGSWFYDNRFGLVERDGDGKSSEAINIDISTPGCYPHNGAWDGTPCRNVWVHHNLFDSDCAGGASSHSSDLEHFCTNIIIEHNTYRCDQGNSLEGRGWRNFLVANNVFDRGGRFHILLADVYQGRVTGNIFKGGTGADKDHSVLVKDSDDVIVAANSFDTQHLNAIRVLRGDRLFAMGNDIKFDNFDGHEAICAIEVTNAVVGNNLLQPTGATKATYRAPILITRSPGFKGFNNVVGDGYTADNFHSTYYMEKECPDFQIDTFGAKCGTRGEVEIRNFPSSWGAVNGEVLAAAVNESDVTSVTLVTPITKFSTVIIGTGTHTSGMGYTNYFDFSTSDGAGMINADNVLRVLTWDGASFVHRDATISSDGLTLTFEEPGLRLSYVKLRRGAVCRS